MIKRPANPYSSEWPAYWAANPSLHRGVGADAAESEGEGGDLGGEGEGAGDGGDPPQAAEWASGIQDEGLRGSVGKFESQEKALEAMGYKAPESDWRDGLTDEQKKTADRFTSNADAIRSIENMRKRESQIRVPGKDASEDEVSAYHKAVGVPETADGYEWPDLGEDITDEQTASRESWNTRLHALNVPGETAKELAKFLREETEIAQNAQDESDKSFATQQEDALKSEWKGEAYGVNKEMANRAFGELANRAGLNLEDLTTIETKDGRLLMDRADMSKIFAIVGKEMGEGTLGPTLTGGEKETIEGQIEDIRGQITAAQNKGESRKADKLYQKEQALLAKIKGNKGVVGAEGRMN